MPAGRGPSSRRSRRSHRWPATRTAAPASASSSGNLHAFVGWLVQELGGIGLEAARQLAEFLRRLARVAQQAFHFRQAVTQEQSNILAMLAHQAVEIAGGGRQVLGNLAQPLR